jgi:hypothetical protein
MRDILVSMRRLKFATGMLALALIFSIWIVSRFG